MRVRLWAVGMLALGAVLGGRAQAVANDAVFAPLEHDGALVIWWIEPTTQTQRAQLGLEKIVPSVPRIPLDQRNASELGQNASTFGQNAGSYGKTASSYGTDASNAGQTAGSYGTSASNLGKNASDVGTSASSYGQAASTLGQNASTFGVAASDTDKRPREMGPFTLTVAQQQVAGSLLAAFSELNLRVVAVPDVQLKDKLTAAAIAGSYPDVVMADGNLPEAWRAIAGRVGVTMLGEVHGVRQEFSDQPVVVAAEPGAAILLGAPHPAAARAFVIWLRERGNGLRGVRVSAADAALAEVAVRAARAVLNGAQVSGADAAMAQFAPELAVRAALASDGGAAPLRVDVVDLAANRRFAVVALRAAMGSATGSAESFGVVYPVVVLRRVEGEGWKVLQISVGLTPAGVVAAESSLQPYTRYVAKGMPVAAVSGLLPQEAETRAPQPELGWQHGEGGSLFVVEWQKAFLEGGKAQFSASTLFFVPDDGTRSQTRVNAQFAEAGGLYRWRVWVLGEGGAVRLSAWQTFTVVGR